jgi:tripartite-type tricarboxylate transporter receptor subunit TctC
MPPLGKLMRIAASVTAVFVTVQAHAQSPADFYKSRTVDLYVGYSVGGGYDLYARVLARHIGRHLPGNPTVVVKNMEGAGSLRLANWLYRVAPKDGSVFATIGRGTGFDPLLGVPAAQFDAPRFTWIGSGNHEVSVCVAYAGSSGAGTAGVTTFADLRNREMTVGGTGASSDTDQFPRVLNGVLGTRMKIVSGYPGGNDVVLAMERGEVQGRCGWSWSSVKSTHGAMIAGNQLHVLLQLSLHKHAELPDVPLVVDLAANDEERQILTLIFARQVMGRPFLAPPGIPADRAEALRSAFMATMTDPAFVAEAKKAQLEVNPVAGEDLQNLVAEIYRTPPEVAKKAAQLLAAK